MLIELKQKNIRQVISGFGSHDATACVRYAPWTYDDIVQNKIDYWDGLFSTKHDHVCFYEKKKKKRNEGQQGTKLGAESTHVKWERGCCLFVSVRCQEFGLVRILIDVYPQNYSCMLQLLLISRHK